MNITFRGLSLSFPAISSSKPTEGSNGTQRGLAKLRRFFLVLIFEGKKVCKLAGRWPFEIPNPFPGYKFSMVKKTLLPRLSHQKIAYRWMFIQHLPNYHVIEHTLGIQTL
jgi:hypothetical protein